MNKIEFIKSKFREILSETIDERVKNIEKNLYDEAPFQGTGEFDYVQEDDQETCEQCGGSEVSEGECKECGYRNETEIMELGGMDDGHPIFGDLNFSDMDPKTRKKLEKYMKGGKDDEDDDFEEISFSDDDEEEFEEIKEKLHGKQHRLDKNKNGRLDREDFKMLRKQQDEEEQLYEVEFEKEVEEGETDESREFAYAAMMAKKKGKDTFELDGETFDVKESYITEKWKGDVDVKQTGEYSDMSIEELNSAIKKQKAKNDKTQESGKKVSHADRTKMSQLYFAKRAKQGWKGKGKAKVKESILYTESDLLDLIESLVLEEKRKFKVTEPKGYREYERAHKADKKENDDYLKSVAKKMTDYLKKSSDSGSKYEMKETKKFPTENGGLKKGIRKKYTPSDAVDDYIDAFSYPGQTNLVFDEIKPTEKNIEKYLKGHRTTGNAQVDDDGNALGNVVPSETGEKFFKNFKDNLYGQEQMDASYKRQPQPVDQAGEETERGSLKSKRGKKTSQSVLNKVEESIGEKSEKKLNEEFGRMHQLMGYNKKTQ
jgi:hypothetical protein